MSYNNNTVFSGNRTRDRSSLEEMTPRKPVCEPVHDPFPAGLRVLVVDDDPTCLIILEKMLRTCRYHGNNFHFI